MSRILARIVEARFADEVEFLGRLVRMPSDNPPGDCAPHPEPTAPTSGFGCLT